MIDQPVGTADPSSEVLVTALRRMRTFLAIVVIAVVGVMSEGAAPAQANAARGWAWLAQRDAAPSLASASGVPDGDVAVAWAGEPHKIGYLGLSVAAPGSDASVVLVVKLDRAAHVLNAATAQLRACLITTPWTTASPMGWDIKPLTSCTVSALGTFTASDSAFRFDITALVRAAGSGAPAFGVSLEPVDAPTAPFDVALSTAILTVVPQLVAGAPPTRTAPPVSAAAPPRVEIVSTLAPIASGITAIIARPTPAAAPVLAARSAAAQATPTGRSYGLGATYALLALLGVLPVVGRALAPFISGTLR